MELKPCPFCGRPVYKKPYTRQGRGSWIRQGVICCSCGTEMRIRTISKHTAELYERNFWRIDQDKAVYSGDVNDVDAVIQFTKDEIVKRWNTRSDNA